MKERKKDTVECPLQSSKVLLAIGDTLDVINGKWRMKIIATLLDGPKRFSEISFVIGITDRMLSIELKKMEANLMVQKRMSQYTDLPEYELTEHAQSLTPVIIQLIEWGQKHRGKIIENQDVKTKKY